MLTPSQSGDVFLIQLLNEAHSIAPILSSGDRIINGEASPRLR